MGITNNPRLVSRLPSSRQQNSVCAGPSVRVVKAIRRKRVLYSHVLGQEEMSLLRHFRSCVNSPWVPHKGSRRPPLTREAGD